MGFGLFGLLLILTVLFPPLNCQGPNTDESFVFEFLQKLGLNTFNENGSLCSWKGVWCDSAGESVIKLDFSDLSLSGVIPDNTIGKLVNLETLDLSNNKITALPSDFWSLGSLKNLNLSVNKISGDLPSNIDNFFQLQSLDLSYNILSGAIPESLSALINLKVLNLSQNGFQSSIPLGLLQCHSLVSIDLSRNNIGGTLPRGFAAAFPGIEFLNLAGNNISGQDFGFSWMKSISYLNASGNLLEGSIDGVLSLSNLRYLDISDNMFGGEFSVNMTHALNLKHLNLANNRFVMHLDWLSTSFEYLNLSGTNLVGQIPGSVSMLSSLKILDLSRNNLSGSIPPFSTDNLQVLDISCNKLTGQIPLMLLGKLDQMRRFNFSYNNLSFCASQFPYGNLETSFIGLVNTCPIAANPRLFKRNAPNQRGLKLALSLALSMTCLLVGLLFLAFGCRRKNRTWEVKPTHCKEEPAVISGHLEFQADSTTWTADVKQATSVPLTIFDKPLLNFTFADLLSATSHFDRDMLLAEGRFGPVYGGLLPGGIHVAVKVLVHGSTVSDREAAREFEYLGRIKHPNLVPLSGYCLAGDQRIAIYDYMENGNLQNLLHDLPFGIRSTEDWSADSWEDESGGITRIGSEGSLTTWRFRYKIALGTARALAFLHHGCSPPIIHRDVKASSIFLDSNLEPRLSDFGLAKIFGNGLEDDIACVAPELLQLEDSSPKAAPTPKSDVYGYGAILFELITGKKQAKDDYRDATNTDLVSWARGLVRQNQGLQAIDPRIIGTGPGSKMVEALKIGYLCTAENPAKRPTMHQVVGLLKDLEPISQH